MSVSTPAGRPLVLDVGCLFEPGAGLAQRATIAALAADLQPFTSLVQSSRQGFRHMSAATVTKRMARMAQDDPLVAVTAWLKGQGQKPGDRGARHRLRPWWPSRAARLPQGAAVLVAGPAGWSGPRAAFTRRRHDLVFVTFADVPPGLGWPDYRPDGEPIVGDLAAMATHSALIVLPDVASETRLRSLAATIHIPPVHTAGPPIPASAAPFDEGLAASDFCLVAGPIEAAANTTLLLHVWRDLVARGDVVPKLVLAGQRRGATEEIRPLLEWNETLRRHIVEAPGLSWDSIVHLMRHARAVLAPAFAGVEPWLAEKMARIGTPMVAAPSHAGLPEETIRVSAIDGPGWREAILALPHAMQRPMPAWSCDVVGSILARAATV